MRRNPHTVTIAKRLFGQDAGILQQDDLRLLLAANGMGALGIALVSPLLDTLTQPFGVSPARIGLMVTVFAAPSIVLIPLSGLLTDHFGRKPVLVSALIIFGVGGVSLAFTTDFRIVLALRAIQGIGSAGLIPVVITALGDIYDGDSAATAQGIRFGVSGVSQALFPMLAGLLVAVAWQYPFFIYGISLPVAVAVWWWFDEPVTAVDDDRQVGDERYLTSLLTLSWRLRSLAYLVARGVVVLPFVGFLTYNSLVVVRVHGGTPQHAGVLVALFSLVFAISATQAGRVSAMFDRPTGPLFVSNLLLGGGLAAFALAPSTLLAAPAVIVMGVGIGLTLSLYRSVITGIAPVRLRGGFVSLSEGSARVVTTLTPVIIGGAITLMEPTLGSVPAVRWAVVATGLVGGLGGSTAILGAHASPPVPESSDVV